MLGQDADHRGVVCAKRRGSQVQVISPAVLAEPEVRAALGLAEEERVVSLIHLGPATSAPPEKDRLPFDDVDANAP